MDKKHGPDSIYNLDESGTTTVQNLPKIIAAKGTTQFGQITERHWSLLLR